MIIINAFIVATGAPIIIISVVSAYGSWFLAINASIHP